MAEPQTGLKGTKFSVGTENTLVRDVSAKIALLQPDDAPLLAFINGLKGKKEAINPKFEWLEDELLPNVVTLANAETTGSTSFELTTGQGTRVRVNDILIGATGESLLVTAIATDTLTVTRSMGGVAAAAYAAGDQLIIAGNALMEGAGLADAPFRYTQKATQSNFTQIFRDIVELTGTQEAAESYGGDDRVFQRMKKAVEHKRYIEQAFLFGDGFEDTSGTQARRGTKGLFNWVTTNITDAGGVITEGTFETALRALFRYHPTVSAPVKWALFSPILISAVNFWAKNALQIETGEKTFGVHISKYVTGHGALNITRHWLLEDFTEFKKYGFLIDPLNVKYRFMRGRDTKLFLATQNKGDDKIVDEYRTEAGLQVMQERTHGFIKNVTGFAA